MSVIFIALLLTSVEPGQFAEVFHAATPWLIVAAWCLFLLGAVLFAFRWRLVLAARLPDPPPIRFIIGLCFIGMFFNFFLPSTAGGDVVRAELAQARSHGRIHAYASVLFDRFVAYNSILVISLSAAILGWMHLDWFDRYVAVAWLAFLIASLGFAGAVLWFPVKPWADQNACGILGALQRPLGDAQGALRGYMADKGLIGRALVLALVAQFIAPIMAIWLLAEGLSIDVPFMFYLVAVPIIMLLTLIPVSFNGIGVREAAFVYLYGKVGIASGPAIALSLGMTLLLLTLGLLGGLCWFCPRLYDSRPKSAQKAPHDHVSSEISAKSE